MTGTKEAIKKALAPIAPEMARVEEIINDELKSSIGRVDEIAHYITEAGGKRMRPALLILMAKALGADSEKAAFLGATIEILHTATLMHDDVVDVGMTRRGRATANAKWGNPQAVLVGDFFYTRSFQMMVRLGNLKVMQALAQAANTLSEGEVLQLTNTRDPNVTEERYFAVIERKTSCLFEAAAHMASAIGNATEAQEKACVDYTLALGNAFQIADDILDYAGSEVTGKAIGTDLREGKVTLPLIYALQCASPDDKRILTEAILSADGDFDEISRILKQTDTLNKCYERAQREVKRGEMALDALPVGLFRDSLIKFLAFAVERDR